MSTSYYEDKESGRVYRIDAPSMSVLVSKEGVIINGRPLSSYPYEVRSPEKSPTARSWNMKIHLSGGKLISALSRIKQYLTKG
jgi:hypothetical protein